MQERLLKRALEAQQSAIRAITMRVQAVGGINLGQGTCDLPPHPEVLAAACRAITSGKNSYSMYTGIAALRKAVAEKYREQRGMPIAPENVLVTSGATGALECICKAFLEPGDEVVLFAPIYQYHVRLIVERGATPRFVPLSAPGWTFTEAELNAAFSAHTKLVVFANPNNPTGKVFTRAELLAIGNACRRHGAIAVADEVYEHIVYAGHRHLSIASLPGMFDHSLTLSSASKTFFVTGWRVGWLVGPAEVIEPLGIKSDETYVCAPTPFQHAVADAMRLGSELFDSVAAMFKKKRDRLTEALTAAGLAAREPAGAYYLLAAYGGLAANDAAAAETLIEQTGVGSIPGAAFFPGEPRTGLLRFCFALPDDRLDRACEALARSAGSR